ncbi:MULTISPECIES: diguanylate cyclase [Halomonadaceae]|uniref:diguanylate cyclase n=1 Tax=Vreelandella piezotolerans TaxID=2609667 RepID=A0ABQ6XA13_9GAMM|nr:MULTISPECIES: diguanylate cyclase [Halomonas]KAE8438849.1 diguanylate cyclase [Halomonas piezotolerans]MCG7577901.1 GGDEF domain-containing protein [Halomonas sp. MMH1-48]MCG7604967.1 GGDEF domain-containing protein [Halomonas sp. MM17-34]MCG7614198.1 GGDEF domain-containing protein [Halomonas sp. MM17-29]MCG7621086.1 GGDEF domain-containing protein [Halomonas sp. DSH1-27]
MTSDSFASTIEHELSHPKWHLRFSRALEARFERDTQPQRNRNMVVAGLIAALIYSLFLINDYSFRPEVFWLSVLIRGFVVLPFGLPILWAVYKGVSGSARETMMASTVVVGMVASCLISVSSKSPYSYLDIFSFGLILVVGNILYSLRFSYALGSSLLSVAIMVYFVIGYDPMPTEVKRLAIFSICAKAVFTLVANYRLEASERKAYLLLLRETHRTGHALRSNAELSKLSLTDPLTELANRRQFDALFNHYWQQAVEERATVGLMVIDIDCFKAYNDYYGHLQGDHCLKSVASTLATHASSACVVARFGGEEFVVLSKGQPHQAVLDQAEQLRHSVEALQLPHLGRVAPDYVTISVGGAVLQPTVGVNASQLFRAADQALYEAKRQGRNRVVMISSPDALSGDGLSISIQ